MDIPYYEHIEISTKFINSQNIKIINYIKDNIPRQAFYDNKSIIGTDFITKTIDEDSDNNHQLDTLDQDDEPNIELDQPPPKKTKNKQQLLPTKEYSFWLH